MAFQFLTDMLQGTSSMVDRDETTFNEGAEGDEEESDLDEDILGPLGQGGSDLDLDHGSDSDHEDNTVGGDGDNGDWSEQLSDVTVEDFRKYDSKVVHDLDAEAEPIDFFHLFTSEAYLEESVTQTNLYAEQQQTLKGKRDERWQYCTLADMKIFLYVNIYFGIKRLPHYAHYFSEHPLLYTEAVAKVISKARYEKLSQYFHLNDSTAAHPRGHAEHDPLFKIRPLLDQVLNQSKAAYYPDKDISFDEAMVQYTGRLYFKQYIRGKPIPWGVKVWCAADPQSGYLLDFSFYTGKSKVGPNGLGYDVITKLGERFLNRGHHFFYDNLFSSVKLATDLLQQGTYSCATVRPNRKGWPKELSKKKSVPKGTTKFRQIGNLVATFWMDKRPVTILSTLCNPAMGTAQRRTKDGPVQKQIPLPVLEYNKSMGGVDLHDQYRSYYPVGRRSKKWWRCCVWFLVQVAMINSWIVYKKSSPNNKLSHLDYRLSVLMDLVKGNSVRKRRKTDATNLAGIAANDQTQHVIIRLHGRKKCCAWCRQTGQKTTTNRVPETVFGCTLCQVHLCKDLCFAAFHANLQRLTM